MTIITPNTSMTNSSAHIGSRDWVGGGVVQPVVDGDRDQTVLGDRRGIPDESGPVARCGPQLSRHRATVHHDDYRTPSVVAGLHRPIDVKTALTLTVNPGYVQDKRLQIRRSIRHRCSQTRTTA
jgi:hypothetical protein